MTTIPTDPVFPLYRVVFHFDSGDGTKEETTTLMRPWIYPTDPGAEDVERQALDVWPTINWRGEERERRLVGIVVERKQDVPWAGAWFAHQTFRAGRSDEELRESFERFVRKHEAFQRDFDNPGYHCLMGAQDRWRWEPFCTCDNCKRDELVLIAH